MATLFASADGTHIACSTGGSGPPLVLVHGTAADSKRWERVVPGLSQRFTIYALDRRGRGASGDGPAYALAREVDDILAVLGALAEPATLLGHSFGGICALEAALRAPRLRNLVLYEPPLGLPVQPPGIIVRLEGLLLAGDRDGVVTTFLRECVRVPEEQLAVLRGLPAWPARLAAAHSIPRELHAQEGYEPDAEALRTLRVPVLQLLGGASPEPMAESTRRLQSALRDTKLVVLPEQRHVAMDTAPELFMREVIDGCA
jgi:pimeloyl-ACP methyl ester carboxylesterase